MILAAGTSSRFGGRNKLLVHEAGQTPLIARAIRACAGFPVVAVCSLETAPPAEALGAVVVMNDAPQYGMAHSLQLADAAVAPERAIAILPADLAEIEPQHLRLLAERFRGVDVLYPRRRDGTPGHPVLFSAQARRGIAALPRGDTIRMLRAAPRLRRLAVEIDDAWPYHDVDGPGL